MSVKVGFIWMLLSEGLGKGASLLAQVALGWLLTKSDFGLFALTNSVAAVTAVIRNGGIQQVLIQSGQGYATLAPVAMKFALLFNVLTCIVLVGLAPLASELYGAPDLRLMLLCIGISVPLVTPAIIFRAKLSIDHRFRSLAFIGTTSACLRQGMMVFLAALGFGPLSFTIPVICESIYLSLAGWRAVGQWPYGVALDKRNFASLFANTRWVMLGTFAAALTQQGDYFIIGLFESTGDLGVYFFALQLTVAISTPFISSIEAVFLPALTRHSNNAKDMSSFFLEAVKGVCYLAIPITIGVATFAEPAINLIWQGRWDDAINPARWLALSIPSALLVSVSRTLLEAAGRWRLRSLMLILHGVMGVSIAGIAAYYGDLADIAIAVAAYRSIFGLAQLAIAGWYLPKKWFQPLKSALQPVLFLGAAGCIGWGVGAGITAPISPLSAAIATYSAFLLAVGILGSTVCRRQGKELLAHSVPLVCYFRSGKS